MDTGKQSTSLATFKFYDREFEKKKKNIGNSRLSKGGGSGNENFSKIGCKLPKRESLGEPNKKGSMCEVRLKKGVNVVMHYRHHFRVSASSARF